MKKIQFLYYFTMIVIAIIFCFVLIDKAYSRQPDEPHRFNSPFQDHVLNCLQTFPSANQQFLLIECISLFGIKKTALQLSDLVYESVSKKCLAFKEEGIIKNATDWATCIQIGRSIELSGDPEYRKHAWKCFKTAKMDFADFFDCSYAYKGESGL